MKWTLVSCERCGDGVLVPFDCAERVERGESTVLCMACVEDVGQGVGS
jgi:hypothetical protein